MRLLSLSWRTSAACAVLVLALASCEKKPAAKPKPLKKEAAAAQASDARQALNRVARLLRQLAASSPDPAAPSAVRAAAMLSKLQSVPAPALPASLRAPWQEMISVLEAVAQSTPPVPGQLRARGEAAAQALNMALAAEGLTDFRF